MNNSSGINMFKIKSKFIYKDQTQDKVSSDDKKISFNNIKIDSVKHNPLRVSEKIDKDDFPILTSDTNKQQIWVGKSFLEVLKTENNTPEKNCEKIKEKDDFEKMTVLK